MPALTCPPTLRSAFSVTPSRAAHATSRTTVAALSSATVFRDPAPPTSEPSGVEAEDHPVRHVVTVVP
eukprot:m.6928 g.6928  ORF g.6928 m.6928 type:complete len:68 (+) comp3891_c0_seq2:992-1195(+)